MFAKLDAKDKRHLYQLIAGISGFAAITIGCIIILRPFFPAILLSVIFTLATWPAFEWLTKKLRRGVALPAFLMTCLLAVCFIVPLVFLGSSLAENFTQIQSAAQERMNGDPKTISEELSHIPYAGDTLRKIWEMFNKDSLSLSATLNKASGPISKWLLHTGGKIGHGLLDLTLGVIIAYFLFRHGTLTAEYIRNLTDRFLGARGRHVLEVTENTLISVVYGIMGTAVALGAVSAFGFWMAGIPGATFLGFITFVLGLIPGGPPLVWIPVVLWLFSEGNVYWGVIMSVYGVLAVGLIDSVVRPYFISLGSDLPLLLVLLGILGGIAAFGFIGLFIGPTLLATAYALIVEWGKSKEA